MNLLGKVDVMVPSAGGQKMSKKSLKLPSGYSAFIPLFGMSEAERFEILTETKQKMLVPKDMKILASTVKAHRYTILFSSVICQ
jgi:hypothetical protein